MAHVLLPGFCSKQLVVAGGMPTLFEECCACGGDVGAVRLGPSQDESRRRLPLALQQQRAHPAAHACSMCVIRSGTYALCTCNADGDEKALCSTESRCMWEA